MRQTHPDDGGKDRDQTDIDHALFEIGTATGGKRDVQDGSDKRSDYDGGCHQAADVGADSGLELSAVRGRGVEGLHVTSPFPAVCVLRRRTAPGGSSTRRSRHW